VHDDRCLIVISTIQQHVRHIAPKMTQHAARHRTRCKRIFTRCITRHCGSLTGEGNVYKTCYGLTAKLKQMTRWIPIIPKQEIPCLQRTRKWRAVGLFNLLTFSAVTPVFCRIGMQGRIHWHRAYIRTAPSYVIIGSRPTRSVCLFDCAEFFSDVFDPISIKL